jgi:hypothetical protein
VTVVRAVKGREDVFVEEQIRVKLLEEKSHLAELLQWVAGAVTNLHNLGAAGPTPIHRSGLECKDAHLKQLGRRP